MHWFEEGEVVATIPFRAKSHPMAFFTGEVFGLEAGSYEMSVWAIYIAR